ncbi:hypothetical protein LPTSP2_23210 [Leptospira ellinghausenii]|uniref:Tetratricopeptide repeat protein n=1 Tax=Leptospira ellinghausenii TaxID=1917822 RepID=A0A2P2DEG3_9LEPT|nr:hypothetical protein [Leptospira ellinghausenii]GBF43025.1 hypothetical protein LPTSP2_23210 [Leptospira ellinghausenii]
MSFRFLIFYLFFVLEILSQTTENWNKKGIDALKNKDFLTAVDSFKKTLKDKPDDAFANYNLACTYSLLLAQCEDIESEVHIYNLIQKAIKSKPSYQKKLLTDTDFVILRGKYYFQKLSGKTKKDILTSITWFGPSPGAYGPMDQFQFKEDGIFIYSKLDMTESNPIGKLEFTGRYKWINDSQLEIQFDDPSPRKEIGKNKNLRVNYSDGKLEIQGFDHQFTDDNDRCSA